MSQTVKKCTVDRRVKEKCESGNTQPDCAGPCRPDPTAAWRKHRKEPMLGQRGDCNVRVALRVRPLSGSERTERALRCIKEEKGNQVVIGKSRSYTYDYVLGESTTQAFVYSSCVKGLVDKFMQGFNATILAYGQTGSGKTYTMGTSSSHSVEDDFKGIVPRVVSEIFNIVQNNRGQVEYRVEVSFMEIHNDSINDLLNHQRSRSQQLSIHEVKSGESMLECLHRGTLFRATGSTNMNSHSSRSHAIFTIFLTQIRSIPREGKVEDSKDSSGEEADSGPANIDVRKSKFHFVDLAGSERLKRTRAVGERMREGININKGLLALGNVISALGDLSRKVLHVPFRDSKITRLLQDSLGGNSQTLMIACVSPADTNFDESLNTLKYANRARNIKNTPVINRDPVAAKMDNMRERIKELEQALLVASGAGSGSMASQANTSLAPENGHSKHDQLVIAEGEVKRLAAKLKRARLQISTMADRVLEIQAERDLLRLQIRQIRGRQHSEQPNWNSPAPAQQDSEVQMSSTDLNKTVELKKRGFDGTGEGEFETGGDKDVAPSFKQLGILSSVESTDAETDGSFRNGHKPTSAREVLLGGTQSVSELKKQPLACVGDRRKERRRRRRRIVMSAEGGANARSNVQRGCQSTDDDATEIFGSASSNESISFSNDGAAGHSSGNEEAVGNQNGRKVKLESLRTQAKRKAKEHCSLLEGLSSDKVNLDSKIKKKEDLIKICLQQQKLAAAMQKQYERKISEMENEVRTVQKERDRALDEIMKQETDERKKEERRAELVKKYKDRLKGLQSKLHKYQAELKENHKLRIQHEKDELKIRGLREEISSSKRQRADLVRKIKDASSNYSSWMRTKTLEIRTIANQSRKALLKVSKLQAKVNQQRMLLKRRAAEKAILKERLKNYSRPPTKTKSPWLGKGIKCCENINKRKRQGGRREFRSPKIPKVLVSDAVKVCLDREIASALKNRSLEQELEHQMTMRRDAAEQLARDGRIMSEMDPSQQQYLVLKDQVRSLEAKKCFAEEQIVELQASLSNVRAETLSKIDTPLFERIRMYDGISSGEENNYQQQCVVDLMSRIVALQMANRDMYHQRQLLTEQLRNERKQVKMFLSAANNPIKESGKPEGVPSNAQHRNSPATSVAQAEKASQSRTRMCPNKKKFEKRLIKSYRFHGSKGKSASSKQHGSLDVASLNGSDVPGLSARGGTSRSSASTFSKAKMSSSQGVENSMQVSPCRTETQDVTPEEACSRGRPLGLEARKNGWVKSTKLLPNRKSDAAGSPAGDSLGRNLAATDVMTSRQHRTVFDRLNDVNMYTGMYKKRTLNKENHSTRSTVDHSRVDPDKLLQLGLRSYPQAAAHSTPGVLDGNGLDAKKAANAKSTTGNLASDSTKVQHKLQQRLQWQPKSRDSRQLPNMSDAKLEFAHHANRSRKSNRRRKRRSSIGASSSTSDLSSSPRRHIRRDPESKSKAGCSEHKSTPSEAWVMGGVDSSVPSKRKHKIVIGDLETLYSGLDLMNKTLQKGFMRGGSVLDENLSKSSSIRSVNTASAPIDLMPQMTQGLKEASTAKFTENTEGAQIKEKQLVKGVMHSELGGKGSIVANQVVRESNLKPLVVSNVGASGSDGNRTPSKSLNSEPRSMLESAAVEEDVLQRSNKSNCREKTDEKTDDTSAVELEVSGTSVFNPSVVPTVASSVEISTALLPPPSAPMSGSVANSANKRSVARSTSKPKQLSSVFERLSNTSSFTGVSRNRIQLNHENESQISSLLEVAGKGTWNKVRNIVPPPGTGTANTSKQSALSKGRDPGAAAPGAVVGVKGDTIRSSTRSTDKSSSISMDLGRRLNLVSTDRSGGRRSSGGGKNRVVGNSGPQTTRRVRVALPRGGSNKAGSIKISREMIQNMGTANRKLPAFDTGRR